MATFVVQGFLNNFYKPSSEGGYGLPNWIMLNVFDTSGQYTNTDVYNAIQASSLANGEKGLSLKDIKDMLFWMIGKEIEGKILVQSKDDLATYEYLDAFGAPNMSNVEGVDNGDGTRTAQITGGYKPDGSQLRWAIAYPVTANTSQFSAIHVTQPYFTGEKGETYTLLLMCNSSGSWRGKEVTINFAA